MTHTTTITAAKIYRSEGNWFYAADDRDGWDHNGDLSAATEEEARAEVSCMFPEATVDRVADVTADGRPVG